MNYADNAYPFRGLINHRHEFDAPSNFPRPTPSYNNEEQTMRLICFKWQRTGKGDINFIYKLNK